MDEHHTTKDKDGNVVKDKDGKPTKEFHGRHEFAGHAIRNGKVTFNNDQDGNPSPNQPVQKNVVDLVDKMFAPKNGVKGLKSLNINSTTGGEHSKNSRHYKGASIDINEINGKPVNKDNPMVEKLQKWLMKNGYTGNENIGPYSKNRNVDGHRNHIHYGGNILNTSTYGRGQGR